MIPPMPPHIRVHVELAVAAWVGALERYTPNRRVSTSSLSHVRRATKIKHERNMRNEESRTHVSPPYAYSHGYSSYSAC